MENKYAVKLLPRAYRDLDGIYAYIAETLTEPVIASKLVDSLEDAIVSLESMPKRGALKKVTFARQKRLPNLKKILIDSGVKKKTNTRLSTEQLTIVAESKGLKTPKLL